MKKFIAFITALAALSCTLTACGNSDGSSSSEKAVSSTAASSETSGSSETVEGSENGADASSAEGSTAEDIIPSGETQTGTSMEFSTEPEELSGHIVGDEAPYMADLKKMFDCLNNKDFAGYLKYTYPAEILDAAMKAQGKTLESMAKEMEEDMKSEQAKEAFPVKLGKVAEYDENDETLKQIRQNIEEFLNDPTSDTDLYKDAGIDIKAYVEHVKDCKIIDVEMIATNGQSEVETFLIYEVDGEGWKFDVTMLSMLSYVKKSKKASANTAAITINKAALTAITDIDAKSGFPEGKFVLGTNSSLDVNVPSGVNADDIRSGMKNYFDKLDDYNYFVVIKNADVSMVVCEKKENGGNVGIYPPGTENTATYEELYKKAKAGELYDGYQENVSEKLKDNE